ncbi:hypothetical protein MHU86_21974 [Fragilaria crotonensis]|nr:hypothetical protein MHU86_21974 [Fragilaria crotonensis]
MISTRLQLHDTNKVKLSFVSSSDPQAFYLFVGRKAQVEWILSEKPFVARRECDPVLVSPAKASTVTLAKDSPVDVLIFEGSLPSPMIWSGKQSRLGELLGLTTQEEGDSGGTTRWVGAFTVVQSAMQRSAGSPTGFFRCFLRVAWKRTSVGVSQRQGCERH